MPYSARAPHDLPIISESTFLTNQTLGPAHTHGQGLSLRRVMSPRPFFGYGPTETAERSMTGPIKPDSSRGLVAL